jgi:hypothetical protein
MFSPPSTDWGTVTNDVLCAQLEACATWRAALDAHEAHLITEFAARDIARHVGYADAATWIAAHTHTTGLAARARVEAADVLAQLPSVHAALESGAIAAEHVRSVVRAAQDAGHEAVTANIDQLLGWAVRLDADRFARRVRRWVLTRRPDPVDHTTSVSDSSGSGSCPGANGPTAADTSPATDGATEADPSASHRADLPGDTHDHTESAAFAARRASSGTDPATGVGFIHAQLPAVEHAIVHDTLWAIADELWRAQHGDHTPPPDRFANTPTAHQRLADALVEMARRATSTTNTTRSTARPLINVLIDLDDLTSRLDAHGIATLTNGTPISAATARRLACEADIIPTILDGNSQPLDLGRSQRLASPAQRHAMHARSTTCEWPECTTPATWCQAHHLIPWDYDGPTDIDNLAWMCNQHHHNAHEGRWQVTRNHHGHITTRPPDHQRPPGPSLHHPAPQARAA